MGAISFKALYNKDLPQIEYLIDKLIPKRGLVYFYGPPKSFKTNLLLYMCVMGHEGKNIFDFKVPKPFRVWWVDEENGMAGMKDKLKKIVKGANIDIDTFDDDAFLIYSGFKLDANWLEKLKNVIGKYKPDLIVIDSIAKVFIGDEREVRDVAKIFDGVKPLIEQFGISIVFIHHARKNKDRTLSDVAGSREFTASADIVLYSEQFKRNKDTKSFLFRQDTNRYDLEIEPLNFDVHGDDEKLIIEFTGLATDNIKSIILKIKSEILAWMQENPNELYTQTEIVNAMKSKNFRKTSTETATQELVHDRVLTKSKKGNSSNYSLLGEKA